MKTHHKDILQVSEKGPEASLPQQWINQHCGLERYILAWFIPFHLLHHFHINPQGRLGKSITCLFLVLVFLGLPLTVTAILDQWGSAPLGTWTVIAIIFGLVGGLTYDTYYSIGLNVSSIGHTVLDKEFFHRQIKWDKFWFNLHIGGTVGATITIGMLASLTYINRLTPGDVIPAGSLLIIGFLAYQIGELACYNLLMCFEARNFAGVEHTLFRFNPLRTEALQRSMVGYSQFGLVTSSVMTVFIAGSAILLPSSAYLNNPVWLILILAVYTIVVLAVILPRYYVQQIIRKTKQCELMPIRQKLNSLFDELMNLSEEEYDEMLRLVKIQDMISEAPDSCLPFSTIGRLFGTLVLPTITFVLAVLGEAYVSTLLQKVLK
jgi:hypothetical protein